MYAKISSHRFCFQHSIHQIFFRYNLEHVQTGRKTQAGIVINQTKDFKFLFILKTNKTLFSSDQYKAEFTGVRSQHTIDDTSQSSD